MSKNNNKRGASNPQLAFTEEEINESARIALEEGTMTDLMGNPITEADLIKWEDGEEKDLSFSQIIKVFNGLQGKVLTIIDASYDDTTRVKFVKDLVKDAFAHQADWLFELTHPESKQAVIKK